MSIFNTTSFVRQGNTENDIQLSSTDEISESVIHLSTTALRSIKIFTPDLEHKLYDNELFRQTLLSFCRGNRHAQIQILAADTSSAIHYGHQLIRLTQQLTSSMQIRNTPEEYQSTGISFLLIDRSSFIFKADSTKNTALESDCKHRTNRLVEFFTPAWEQAMQDPQTQRLRL